MDDKEKEQEAGADSLGSAYSRTPADLPPGESGSPDLPMNAEPSLEELQLKAREAMLLEKARTIFTTSTDYMEASVTPRWETSLSHFNNEHAPGSRYSRQNFKRSRVFRPKTRSSTKNQEAALAAAAFSTQDYVSIEAVDKTDETQLLSAKVNKSIIQYRLKKKMPWFLTVIGAYQDTKNYGVCITHQHWRYQEEEQLVPALDENGKLITDLDEEGNEIPMGVSQSRVVEDKLHCDNIPPENFRFDPMCDWRNPVESSPYLIYMMPMYAGDVLERMDNVDPKTGQPPWKKYTLAEILATRSPDYGRTRQAREGRKRLDPALDQKNGNEYTTVWAHMNIVRQGDEDVVWWTLGTTLLLSHPMRLTDMFPHLERGERPFVLGFSNIEAHKNYPAGDNELAAGLQSEINDIANQRMDNVKLVLNKRYYIKRGSMIDLDALMRNVPGGGVMVNDPERDVKTVDTRDVTGSSYQEQDRLAVEMDELIGGFSNSAMAHNQGSLGTSVGGMKRMSQSAGSVQDYSIRLFMETWMEPCLRQLVKLVQMYETDQVILALAAKESGAWQRFGMQQVTDDLLRQELTVSVDAGIGNTDPAQRIDKLIFGVTKSAELPGMVERIKSTKISDEIFGVLGYKDGSRFFMTDDEFAKAQQDAPPPEPPLEIQVKELELQIRKQDNDARHQREQEELQLKREIEFARLAMEKELKLEDLYAKLGVERTKNQTQRDVAALKESNRLSEMNHKRAQEGTTQ